jgi:hypothetical protein
MLLIDGIVWLGTVTTDASCVSLEARYIQKHQDTMKGPVGVAVIP